jgi:hypothetical protein
MAKQRKTRVRRVPATTNNITQAIINYLRNRGHFACRINNGAVYDPRAGIFRSRRKDDPALADIHCTLKPSGVSFWIEVKNSATKDKPTAAQIAFAKEIQQCGGMHFFATSYKNFLTYYESSIYDDTTSLSNKG